MCDEFAGDSDRLAAAAAAIRANLATITPAEADTTRTTSPTLSRGVSTDVRERDRALVERNQSRQNS